MTIALFGNLMMILLAMALGYAITTLIGIGITFFFTKFFPQMVMKNGSLRNIYRMLNLTWWTAAAILGGAVIVMITDWHPLVIVFITASILFAVMVKSAIDVVKKDLLDYEVIVAACAFCGMIVGGALRLL